MLPKITAEYDGNVVTLLDLPASIERAQETTFRLRADKAPDEPYPSTEPKGVKLQQALDAIEPAQLRDGQAKALDLEKALLALSKRLQQYGLPWCFTRTGRLLVEEGSLSQFSTQDGGNHDDGLQSSVPIVLSTITNRFGHHAELQNKVVMNPSADQAVVAITNDTTYLMPPRSTFILGSIREGTGAFEKVAPSAGFDLIIMDPPWTNRSIRRSREYKTVENQDQDPFEEAVRIVGSSLKCTGVAAVWVTNKATVRAQVVAAMRDLGLQLRSEITWLKVTSTGLPVTALNGVWRKPYECLLIFSSRTTSVPQSQVVVAVPDVHSRKPAMRTFFEPRLPSNYTALELFARSLNAGWTSWGDEVLKFQDSRAWH